MKIPLQKELQNLQKKVLALTEENEILTEKAEDIYLLGIISEKISLEPTKEQVIRVALENIVTLKDIAYCAFLMISDDSITVSDDFSLKLPDSLKGNVYKQDNMLKAALQNKDYFIELKQGNVSPAFIPEFKNEPYPNSCYLAPLIVRGNLYGMHLCVNTLGDSNYLKSLIPMLERVGELVGTRLETLSFLAEIREINRSLEKRIEKRTSDLRLSNIQLEQEIADRQRAAENLETKVREMTALNQLSHMLSSNLSLDKVIHAALESINSIVRPDLALLFLREGDNLLLKGCHDSDQLFKHKEIKVHKVGECLCGQAARNGTSLFSLDISADPRCTWEECKEAGLRSFSALPLRSGNNTIGVIGLASANEVSFEKNSIFLETLAGEIAIGLHNASLFSEAVHHNEELDKTVSQLHIEITAHRQSKIALERSHQRLLTVLNSLDAIVYVADMNTYEILFVNQFVKDLFGEIEGTTCWQNIQSGQAGPCEFCTNRYLIDKDGKPTEVYEWEFQNTQNNHWYDIRDRAVYWIDGRIVRLEIAADITERKNVERERENFIKQLAIKNKDLEQILFATSHDLRTPLVNIKGFSDELELSLNELNQLIQNESLSDVFMEKASAILDEDIPESIGFINAGTNKMTELLNALLQVSRLGKTALQLKKLDMNKLMADVTRNFNYALNTKDVQLIVHDLPSCMGDRAQVSQVLFNLLDNALKYLDPHRKGIIKINGEVHDTSSVYSVEDNGVGINPEYQGKIFEIFHQLDPSIDGEGLGLTIVNKIIEKHHGEIWLESGLDKGSKFSISLPSVNE